MKKQLLFFLGLLFVLAINAQTTSPDVIASSGDHYTLNEISMSMTFGECLTETYITET